jgi:cytochrome b involved in lipid metabolism
VAGRNKTNRARRREFFLGNDVFPIMRFLLALLLVSTLAGCAASEPQGQTQSQSQSSSTQEADVMDPMDPMDPMESETEESAQAEGTESSSTSSSGATKSPTATASPSPTSTQTQSGYTLADVAKRNTPSECWVAIDGNVYDLTAWISQHPGGSGSIRTLCGTDGTSQFLSKHGGEARPSSTLDRYLLGPLVG